MSARAVWKGVVAWSYLAAALMLLPLLVEFGLEQVGVIHGPALEDELPDSVLIVLMFDALAVGGVALVYWPVAAATVLFWWRSDRRFAIPAVLFLIADGLLFLNVVLALPDSGPLFWVCMAFGWFFAIAALHAWFSWIRRRTGRSEDPTPPNSS